MSGYFATYNMSFSSDAGQDLQFASEATFLNKSKNADRRLYWKNALMLLKIFIVNKKPVAVSLQEMNFTTYGTNTGTNEVINMLSSVNQMGGKKYDCISSQVESKNGFPALSIIYDTKRLGPVIKMKITSIIEGRPVMMVLTMNNTLLINVHGAQDPKLGTKMNDFNDYMQNVNVKFIQEEVKKFIKGEDVQNVFIMGDFNDRYDAIRYIKIEGNTLTYMGDSPYSCCHNWDSSCSSKRFTPFTKQYGTCTVEPAWSNKKILMEEEGFIQNYRYKGDKIFGIKPKGNLKMFNKGDKDKRGLNYSSTESDHELVYAEFFLN